MADTEQLRAAYRDGHAAGYADGWRAACRKLLCEHLRLTGWLQHGAASPIGTRCDPGNIQPGEDHA